MVSIGKKLDLNSGVGPGFDFLRVALSLGIVTWHSFYLSPNTTQLENTSAAWLFGYGLLFMFFALSGFLITGSAQRLSLGNFLVNRGLRIFPALIVEIALSAFVLGPLFTSLSLRAYLSQPETYRYLTNIIGLINYQLPGVFDANPVSAVNWSLWTIPYEFICYAIMSGCILLGLLKRPGLLILASVSMAAIGTLLMFVDIHVGKWIDLMNYLLFQNRGARLFVAFIGGIAIYLLRHCIPYSHWLAGGCVLICAAVALSGPLAWQSFPLVSMIAGPALVYLTAYIGASSIPALPVFRRGDYSYGIYLYGMPIQQAAVSLFPWVLSPLAQLLFAVPAIVIFAAFSWHFIEKPILRARQKFSFVANVRGVETAVTSEGKSTRAIVAPGSRH